ncbi:MAG: hypothetical protein WC657_06075 [Candidatus Paceibacterota bacterium]|jgi:hypothetical protein
MTASEDISSIFPPDPPIIPAAKFKPRQPQAGDQASDDTTVSFDATAVRVAVTPDADPQPDMVFTADWLASASLHSDSLETQLARKDAVIANLIATLDASEMRNQALLADIDALTLHPRPNDDYTLVTLRATWPHLQPETRPFVAERLLDDLCKDWHARGYAWSSLVHIARSQRLGPLPMEMGKVAHNG